MPIQLVPGHALRNLENKLIHFSKSKFFFSNESINNFTMKYGRCQFNSYQAMRYETSKTNWSIFQNPNSFFRTRLFFSVKLQILRNCSSIVIFQTVICFRKKFLNQRPFFLNFVLKLKVLIWTKVNCFPLVGDCTKPLWKTLYAQK